MDAPAIETICLTKSYNNGKLRALDAVSLKIEQGEVFGLIGPNGAGKSTLVGLLLGLLRASSGEVRIFGRDPFEKSIRRQTGYLPERPQFDAWMTVWQFLRYHHMLAGLPAREAKRDIQAALERVQLPPEIWKRNIRKLSRGLLQRVGLAQMLIGRPTICFMDEPDSGMDPVGTQLVRGIIIDLKKQGCTILVNSHHLDEVERTCDRVAFIAKGKIRSVHELQEGKLTHSDRTMRFAFAPTNGKHSPEQLNALVERLGVSVLEASGSFARFNLPENLEPYMLIKELVRNDVDFDEAHLERRSLEELFRDLICSVEEAT